MSKLNTLVQKTTVFEKLALYGDKHSFIQKISQRTPDAGASLEALSKITALGRSVLELLKASFLQNKSPYLQSKISNLELFLENGLSAKSAKALHDYLLKTEKEMAPDPDYSKIVQQIDKHVMEMEQELKTVNYALQQSVQDAGVPKTVTPNDLPNAPEQAKQYPPIPKEIQVYLNGLGSPIKLKDDGILGPDTQKALQWFKDTFKYPFSGQALYAGIANEFKDKKMNPTMPDLDDAARKQQELATNFQLT